MKSLQRMWVYFADVKWSLRAAAVLSALTTMSTVALLATSGWLIARASQMPPVLDLSIAIVGVRTFALLRSVTRYSERLVSHNATFSSLPYIRIALFNKLEELTPSGLAQFHRGDLMARVVADVDDIQDLPLRVYLPILASGFSAIFCVALVGWILPIAGAVLAIALLVSAIAIPRLTISAGNARQQATAQTRSELSESLLDYYEGLADITMLDASEAVFTQIDHANDEATTIESSFATRTGLSTALMVAVQGLTVAASAYVAYMALHSGSLSAVNTVVIGLVPLAAFESVTSLPNAMLSLRRVRGAANRLTEILATEDANADNGTSEVDGLDVSLSNVTARWPSSPRTALSNVSFIVETGSTLALIGQSGSGKSSAIATIIKLLNPESGTVMIGGQDIANLAGTSIRKALVATGHDAHIFATSIAENLRLAAGAHVSDEDLWVALDAACISDWVRSLPNGLETVLGEQGATISGGQRQRILLARLFALNPSVWIVDEPTEHLDSLLADRVLANIRQVAHQKSLIIATHRLSDTASSDKVIVLDNGQVIEQGQQGVLLSREGYFSQSMRHEEQARARINFDR